MIDSFEKSFLGGIFLKAGLAEGLSLDKLGMNGRGKELRVNGYGQAEGEG